MAQWIVRVSDTSSGIALTDPEKKQNAENFYSVMSNIYGWSLSAIAGALGSIEIESGLNPGACEIGRGVPTSNQIKYGGGLGLIQWTDYPAYTASHNHPILWYANEVNENWYDGTTQCKLLNLATDVSVTSCGENEGSRWGWMQNYRYPSISFANYKTFTGTPEDAAEYWFYDMEWHYFIENGTLSTRKTKARYWYDYLVNLNPDLPDPSPSQGFFRVIVAAKGNGTVVASPDSGNGGETITLTATANGSDTFDSWFVSQGNVVLPTVLPNIWTTRIDTFTLPQENVIIRAEFTGSGYAQQYNLTILLSGKVNVNLLIERQDGSTSIIRLTCDEHTSNAYSIQQVAVTNRVYIQYIDTQFTFDSVSPDVTFNGNYFAMPDHDVVISINGEYEKEEKKKKLPVWMMCRKRRNIIMR